MEAMVLNYYFFFVIFYNIFEPSNWCLIISNVIFNFHFYHYKIFHFVVKLNQNKNIKRNTFFTVRFTSNQAIISLILHVSTKKVRIHIPSKRKKHFATLLFSFLTHSHKLSMAFISIFKSVWKLKFSFCVYCAISPFFGCHISLPLFEIRIMNVLNKIKPHVSYKRICRQNMCVSIHCSFQIALTSDTTANSLRKRKHDELSREKKNFEIILFLPPGSFKYLTFTWTE